MTARQAAIDLIKPYVLRGDDPAWIKQPMGYLINGTEVYINLNGRTTGKDKIIVRRLEGKEINATFSFRDICDEIKRGTSQPALL
jgi:hypothetical protein